MLRRTVLDLAAWKHYVCKILFSAYYVPMRVWLTADLGIVG